MALRRWAVHLRYVLYFLWFLLLVLDSEQIACTSVLRLSTHHGIVLSLHCWRYELAQSARLVHLVILIELSDTLVMHVQMQVQCLHQFLINLILDLTLDFLLDGVDHSVVDFIDAI